MPNEQAPTPIEQEHPQPGQPWSDRLAQWYITNYGDYPTYTLALGAAHLKGTETFLDIGCGNGTAVRTAADALPHGRAFGIDPTPAMIRAAQAQSRMHPARQRMDFIEAPAEALPIDSNSVDVAIAVGALHHWGDIEQGLAEIARVLKPNGRLIVAEDIFDDPGMGMDITTIRALIDTSPLTVAGASEQSHDKGRAHILKAILGDAP